MKTLVLLCQLTRKLTLTVPFSLILTDQKFSFDPKALTFRSLDGSHDDPNDAQAGAYGSFFGRNMFPQDEIDAKRGKMIRAQISTRVALSL